ncbi:hypothetical protein HID58_001496 [Brassica napus]|uniref:RING-type domain-containing protein n=1 Tax=Brassica napus TaxID=3708 RepID=A0ABQ8EJT3_BRANA|nr:hypothetical protein HID58_001496 [Brassica napus]
MKTSSSALKREACPKQNFQPTTSRRHQVFHAIRSWGSCCLFIMGINYLSVSVASTALSFVGLQVLTELSLDKLLGNGMIAKKSISLADSEHSLDLLLASYFTIALLAIFVLNCCYFLSSVFLQTLFFGDLFSVEAKTLVVRLANYIIYKGIFLPLVIPPTIFQGVLWTVWLTVLCTLKMFQALARDRLERLNASPSSTPRTYFRAYSVLFLVLSVDFLWIKLSLMTYKTIGSSVYLFLLFEPCSIAFETLQALLIHGFQLLDMWINHLAVKNSDCRKSKFLDSMTAGSLLEWKGLLNRNLGFFLDMATLVMALCHFLYIWWLHGLAFPVVDAVLLLYVRALLSVILKRIKGYIKLRVALGSLHAALPDATYEELRAYDDECAICREPMAKAKKLHCNHLFHLGCLRSWLDQGLNEVYSCPTCRKPLFAGRTETEVNPRTAEVSSDEQLARQLERQNNPGHPLATGLFPADIPNPIESDPSRELGLDPSWLQTWSGQGVDMAGPSSASRSVGLGRVQMMMRHLASVGESYAQNALDDAAWRLAENKLCCCDSEQSSPDVNDRFCVKNTERLLHFHFNLRSRGFLFIALLQKNKSLDIYRRCWLIHWWSGDILWQSDLGFKLEG